MTQRRRNRGKNTANLGTTMKPVAKAPISRRHFLRGLGGVTVGLPFLEALAPRSASAQTATIQRFGVFYGCIGVEMGRWFPNGAYGPLTDDHLRGTANEALIPFRDRLLFPRGLHMAPRGSGRDPGGPGGDHERCMGQKLTAYQPRVLRNEDELVLGRLAVRVSFARAPKDAASRNDPKPRIAGAKPDAPDVPTRPFD